MRLAVLTDRLPSDPEWKGAHIWQLIQCLAESHHEVTVFTTQDPAQIEIEHPRLNIAQPADSWGLDRWLHWMQALTSYKPEVIHTFALEKSKAWAHFTIWPALNAAFQLQPDIQRICTLFETADLNANPASRAWVQGSHRWTLFSKQQRSALQSLLSGPVEIAPLEFAPLEMKTQTFHSGDARRLLIPAPVSAWRKPAVDLCLLADFLKHNSDCEMQVLGGWGQWTLRERREGWETLRDVAHQVTFLPRPDWRGFQDLLAESQGLWLRTLTPDTWTYLVSQQLAEQHEIPVYGVKWSLIEGSTANFMSRLYTNSRRDNF